MADGGPSDNLYISGLPEGFTDDQFKAVFGAYGNIQQCRVLPGRPGQSTHGLIRLSSATEAQWIVDNLNGNMPQGLTTPVQVTFKKDGKGGGKEKGGGDNHFQQFAPPPMMAITNDAGGGDNLYVTGLPMGFTDDQFKAIFGAYGSIVDSRVLVGRPGQPPHALVRYASATEAKWVKENLSGNMPQGLAEPVVIEYKKGPNNADGYGKAGGKGAQPPPPAYPAAYSPGPYDGGKGKGDGGKGGKGYGIRQLVDGLAAAGAFPPGHKTPNDECALYVHGLPSDTTNEDLYKMFSPFGAIAGVRSMWDQASGMCKGFGFVNYMEKSVADNVISILNGSQLPDGKTLTVKVKKGSGKGNGDPFQAEGQW